jgi:hypothetical protein
MSDELAENEALEGTIIETEESSGKELTVRYPEEELGEWDDDGTMVKSLNDLRSVVIGHRIVNVDKGKIKRQYSWDTTDNVILTLDNGYQVALAENGDCCAYTQVDNVIMNLDHIDHVIMGVGTTEGYTKWHIYADLGDVVELEVGWSCGNPFYYGYGFDILVKDANGQKVALPELES